MVTAAVLVYLLIASGVAGPLPRVPRARHRDVVTTQGEVRGYFAPRPPHYAYLGLPYARPPTRGRFKAPIPPSRWDGIFEATHRIKCPQPDGSGVEDCLVLNVFSPEHAGSLPVLVHVHDGGFQTGWGSHETPVRLLRLGFIVVTFNYRLGALGFLCVRTPGIPGNAGLKDQVAALYWVNRNIDKFGGNPQDVTLYGTGSGGVSVELLLLSNLTRDLLHKAIIESGAVLSPATIFYDPLTLALAQAIEMGFKGREHHDLEMFYSKIPLASLVGSSGIFHPCIENSLLPNSLLEKDPLEILYHGKYQHIPLLISYTKPEQVSVVEENIQEFNATPQTFEHLLPSNLAFENEDTRHKIADLVKDFYFDKYELFNSAAQNYMDYINDVFMEYPISKSTMLHSSKSSQPVYLMKYSYRGLNDRTVPSSDKTSSVRHGDISRIIFSSKDIDGIVAERLLTMWSNFVKLGDPTPITTTLIPIVWEPVSVQHVDYIGGIGKINSLQFDRTITNNKPEGQQLMFWDYIYDKFYKKHV